MINSIADPLMPNGISGDMRIFRIERGFIVSKQFPQGRLSHSGFGSQCLPTESRGYQLIVADFRDNLSATLVICRKVYESAMPLILNHPSGTYFNIPHFYCMRW